MQTAFSASGRRQAPSTVLGRPASPSLPVAETLVFGATIHFDRHSKYHVVIVPEYRKKVIYGKLRRQIGPVLRSLCQQRIRSGRGVKIISPRNSCSSKELWPTRLKVFADWMRISERSQTMKQKQWLPLVTCLAYCIDEELYYEIDHWREQNRCLWPTRSTRAVVFG